MPLRQRLAPCIRTLADAAGYAVRTAPIGTSRPASGSLWIAWYDGEYIPNVDSIR